MAKKILDLKLNLFCISLSFLFISSTCYAEIYKWVDENGKIHYSDKKPETDEVKVDELKIKTSPNPTSEPNTSIPDWKERDLKLQQNLEQRRIEKQKKPRVVKKAKKGWGGNQPETDATKCALARDIINGSATLRNGSEVDANDKKLAQSEIHRFCH